jgi:hypothetical protein
LRYGVASCARTVSAVAGPVGAMDRRRRPSRRGGPSRSLIGFKPLLGAGSGAPLSIILARCSFGLDIVVSATTNGLNSIYWVDTNAECKCLCVQLTKGVSVLHISEKAELHRAYSECVNFVDSEISVEWKRNIISLLTFPDDQFSRHNFRVREAPPPRQTVQADQIRAGHQPENCQGAWPHRSAHAASSG